MLARFKSTTGALKFLEFHRQKTRDFTRNRKLTFELVVLVILQKSVKSLQLALNEFFQKCSSPLKTVGASAFTKARQKLSHTAFIELNQVAVVETVYEDSTYRQWKGHRLLGVDGSKIILPDTPEIREEFGGVRIANQLPTTVGSFPMAVASVCYDSLNHIALDSVLTHARAYEVDLAMDHLAYSRENDVWIFDRGYPSYFYLTLLLAHRQHFIGRCSKGSFPAAQKLFRRPVPSKRVMLRAPHYLRPKLLALGLPLTIAVRFVTVILKTGEVEVLVTSLLDETLYPASEFGPLYYLRWGVETFYGRVKGRLALENFTGKTPEAIKQDFYSTILISGVESVLTEEGQHQLDQKSSTNRYPRQVNKAVSFNTIKHRVFDLFYTQNNLDQLLEDLTQLFLTNPTCHRPHRNPPRQKSKDRKLLQFHLRTKKICF